MPTNAIGREVEEIISLLASGGQSLSTAESLTGGGLGAMITSVPGASKIYLGGVIAYNANVKENLLGVRRSDIEEFGVVSQEVAMSMAQGARKKFSSTWAEWALKNNIWIIADEIYEHLLYDGATAPSMPVLVPGLADTTIIVNGVAKTYAMTGWRVGWMIGPKDVIKAATNLQSHLTSNVSNVSQRAAIAAVTGDLAAVHKMGEAFNRRRKLIVSLLNEIPGFSCPTPTGAFYVYPSVKGVLGKTIRGKTPATSAELATLILEEVEVAAVPGEAFGPSGYLRFSYALSDEDIVEGIGRIKKLVEEAN